MADHDNFDARKLEYFTEEREQFVQRLVNNEGLKESKVRQFMAEKGVYCASPALAAHLIELGDR